MAGHIKLAQAVARFYYRLGKEASAQDHHLTKQQPTKLRHLRPSRGILPALLIEFGQRFVLAIPASRRLVYPHTRRIAASAGSLSGNGPKANFWSLGFAPTYYTTPIYVPYPSSFSYSPLSPCCPFLSTILYNTIDSRTSLLNERAIPSVHRPLTRHLPTCLTLLTDIATLPGASSTIACK